MKRLHKFFAVTFLIALLTHRPGRNGWRDGTENRHRDGHCFLSPASCEEQYRR